MAYQPNPSASVTVAASTASASGTLPANGKTSSVIYVFNATTAIAYVRFSVGASTATTSDFPVGPGTGLFLAKGQGADTVSVVLSAGTGNVTFGGCDGNTY